VVSRTLNGVASTWSYDQQGRLQSQGDPIGTFTYAYVSNSGRVQTLTYPNGQTTTYAYYPVAQDLRLQEIHHKKPDLNTLNKFTYTYDALGNIRTWTQQMDATPAKAYDFGYDRADQLTVATYRTTDPTPSILKRYRYAYDPAGNRTAEQIDDAVTGASYDGMNRLTSQQPGGALLFRGTVSEPATVTVGGKPATVTADNVFTGTTSVPSGTSQVVVQATDASGNVRSSTYALSQSGAAKTFTYDANGNLTDDGTKTYEWDAENRLQAVKQGGNSLASFTYDGGGRRSTKTAGGLTTTYVYDGAQFLEERPSTGASKRYVYGPGVDQTLAQVVGGVTSYFIADHLGSIVRTTDGVGAVTLTRQYDPWGNPIQGSTTSGYAFTGREWDAETSVYYYRARYYDATFGRFISEDPEGLSEGPHLYRYVGNAPILFRDPSGMAVDLNLFNRNNPQDAEAWEVSEKKLYSPKGWFTVAAHGLQAGNGIKDERGRFVGPKDVAARIRPRLGKKECELVKLFICYVGGGSFAQSLADELGIRVEAPTGLILFSMKLQYGIAHIYPSQWKRFTPKK
jgi:RHS repeat-associated protein